MMALVQTLTGYTAPAATDLPVPAYNPIVDGATASVIDLR